MKIGILIYTPLRKRRKSSNFDALGNIGVRVLENQLRKNNYNVGYCTIDTASAFDIVLIGLTSIYDCLSLINQTYKNKAWRERNFFVIAGGFGMQNPLSLSGIIDAAWFGRAEDNIIDIIDNFRDYEHPSYMFLSSPKKSVINQTDTLYKDEIKTAKNSIRGSSFQENIIGCPNKCFYCHYTWARKYVGKPEHFVWNINKSSQELDMFNIDDYNPKIAELTVGLDGYSERVRFSVNRNVSNEAVREFLIGITKKTKISGDAIRIKLYNITGFENESVDDYQEFLENIYSIECKLKKKLLLLIHTTPLRPSIVTPLQWTGLKSIKMPKRGQHVHESNNLSIYHDRFNESEFSRLLTLSITRYNIKHERLLLDLLFNNKIKKLKNRKKMYYYRNKYDLHDLYREYSTSEKLPFTLLSYSSGDSLKKIREKQIAKINRMSC